MMNADSFMCRHNPEGLAECEAVYTWALEHLQCEPANLVDNIVYTLTAVHNVGRVEIWCDQWAAVKTDKYLVQCDRVEDGLSRLLQLYVENDSQ